MPLMDVLLDEMRDLYSAENQLVKALPKLVKGANDQSLKSGLKNHLEETKNQVLRLREAFGHLGKKPTGQHCNGMEGLVEEGQDALEKDEEGANKDLCIVGAAARVEHYEIAGYTVAIALAKGLGLKEVAALLNENLQEEVAAAKTLFASAKPLLKQAASEDDAHENEEEKKPKSAKEKKSEKESQDDEQEASSDVSKTGK
ncbi:ferritin-like domain-containing protein [Terriglobus sp.]|uniref:YciE/YciF ferroxidase family protein n=1 Tax=Terriglobus sp. TaxID=1889013 RepID=UPI003AFFE2DF